MSSIEEPSDKPLSPKKNAQGAPEVGGRYAKYVLGVLVIVYIFNFIDRQILSILAEDIKADLGINDAEIGFLYGTVFAVFYAIFGIPLGKLADVWVRKKLIAVGLGFWSVMTALSGTARSFAPLAAFRIGVGVGEASATPAAYSMLSDYFPASLRTTALSVYSSGVYIGAGIGIFLGGVILDYWNGSYPDHLSAPFQLKGWQAAFFAVGLPGLLMALWVATLKEPRRGLSDGLETPEHPHPFREAGRELLALLPGTNFFALAKLGGGAKSIVVNLIAGFVVVIFSYVLTSTLGNPVQWVALGVGIYCAFSWAQALALKDPAAFSMIFKTPTLLLLGVGVPCFAFITYGIGFWAPSFFLRMHEVGAAEAGKVLGLSAAVGGWFGVTAAGVIADRAYRQYASAKVWVALLSMIASLPFIYITLTTPNLTTAYVCNFFFSILSPMWIGPMATTVNDLMLPRMRAMASAFYLLMITFIGLALGPFMIGQISDIYGKSGASSAEALQMGMLLGCCISIVSIVLLFIASKTITRDLDTRLERARDAGESL